MRQWLDPGIVGTNRQPMSAIEPPLNAVEVSQRWRFHLCVGDDNSPAGFESLSFDDTSWEEVELPNRWRANDTTEATGRVGHYRVAFQVPDPRTGRRVYIRFKGVGNAFHLWVDGVEVGYSTDSALPATFDISESIAPDRAEHHLAVRVYESPNCSELDRYCDAGLSQTVQIWSSPSVHLADLDVRTPMRDDFVTASIEVRARVLGVIGGHRLRIRLSTHNQTELIDHTAVVGGDATLVVRPLGAPRRWFAEDPYLHNLQIDLQDKDGAVVDSRQLAVGIRDVRTQQGRLLVNGIPTELRGTNSWGVMERSSLRPNLELMKQNNINAIRARPHHDNEALLELCDLYGLYVVADANTSPGSQAPPISSDQKWNAQFRARTERMVALHKNHPCVIVWNVGSDSEFGRGLGDAATWLREHDPSRPILCPTADHDPSVDMIGITNTDHLQLIAAIDDDRPIVLWDHPTLTSESAAGFDELWQMVRSEQRLAGCFISNWAELSSPDPNPALQSLRKTYEPVTIEVLDPTGDQIRLVNRHQFLDLQIYELAWELRTSDNLVDSGRIEAGLVLAGTSTDVSLPINRQALAAGHEHWVTITVIRPPRTRWAPAGHEVAFGQYRLISAYKPEFTVIHAAPAQLEWEVDDHTGGIGSLTVHGNELVTQPLVPWVRFPDSPATAVHRLASLIAAEDGTVTARIILSDPESSMQVELRVVYRHVGSALIVSNTYQPDPAARSAVERLGTRGELSAALESLDWFGPGPTDTFPTCHKGARIAGWSRPISQSTADGNHHATRWSTIRAGGGIGLLLNADSPFDLNVFTSPKTTVFEMNRQPVPTKPAHWRFGLHALDPAADPFVLSLGGLPGPPETMAVM